MRIRWHGHACFEFGDSERVVVLDPHDGRSIGIKPPVASADIILMTHNHYDHNAVRSISGKHTDIMSRTGVFDVKGMVIEGLPSFHDTSSGNERGLNTMYIFEMDGISVCHCGDLGDIPYEEVMSRIKGVDILLVPTGEVFTMVLPEVKRFVEMVNPSVVIPMHYRVGGLSIPISPLDDFLELIPEDNIDYVGNEIEISIDDITDIKACWVFDR